MKNKGLWLLFGYTLFTLGITAIVLELVGVHWVILSWLELVAACWHSPASSS